MSFPSLVAMWDKTSPGAVGKPRPTSVSSTITNPTWSSITSPELAYDVVSSYENIVETTTNGEWNGQARLRTEPETVDYIESIFSDFSGSGSLAGSLYLRISAQCETRSSVDESNTAVSYIVASYSTDSGSSWTDFGSVYGTTLSVTEWTAFVNVTDRSTFRVRVKVNQDALGTTISDYAIADAIAQIYDIVVI